MCASGARSKWRVDKRDVVALTLFGQGAPTISPIPPTSPFYAHDIVIPKADPAAARKLLAEAGHPNGLKIQLIVPVGRPVRERLGVTLQQLAQPAGFDIDVQRVPFSSYDAEVSGKAPFYIDGYFVRPTVDTSTYPFLHSNGSWNEDCGTTRMRRWTGLSMPPGKPATSRSRRSIMSPCSTR